MNGFEQVKLLFDYTKFHIGVYTTIATILVAVINTEWGKSLQLSKPLVWTAIILIAVAGVAGGTIASSLPHYDTLDCFMSSWIGPYRFTLMTGEVWTYVEHTSFWFAAAAIVSAFGLAAHKG